MTAACVSLAHPHVCCSYLTRKLNPEATGVSAEEDQEVKAAKEDALKAGVVFGEDVTAAKKTEHGNGDERYSYRLGPLARQTVGPSVILGMIETVMEASYDKEQVKSSLGLELAIHDTLMESKKVQAAFAAKAAAKEKARRAMFGPAKGEDKDGDADGDEGGDDGEGSGAGAGAGAGAGSAGSSSSSGRKGRGRGGK